MTKMKTSLLAAVAIGALSLGYSTDANATAYAVTEDTVSQLRFTAEAEDGSLIPFNSFLFSASTAASLASGDSDGDTAGPVFSAFSNDRFGDAGVDPDPANAGTASNANNDFTPNGQSGASYARGDHFLSDTLVNTSGGCGVGSTCGGDFQSITESFVSLDTGSASAVNSQTWGLDFTVPDGETAEITIEFNLDLNQIVNLNGEVLPALASADFNLTFEVDGEGGETVNFASLISVDGNDVLSSDSADESDVTASTDASGVTILDAGTQSGDVRHFAFTFTVGEGDHSFRINYGAAALTNSVVPEPVTLGLLGAGLLGLGALARRRKIAA